MRKYGIEIISFVLLAVGIVLGAADASWFHAGGVACVWFLAALLPVGLPVLRESWESLRKGEVFNEFMLMTLAAIGAFCIGEYPEGVAVMLFYSVGEKFQEGAVAQARGHIKALMDVRPDTAVVLREGERVTLAPEKVRVGEIVEVRAGERVPLDGELLDGEASFNTSALTGESVPQESQKGDEVLAGVIAIDRTVRLRVTRPYGQSALSRVLAMVEEAAGRKAPAELLIRRLARVYTPLVTGLAALIVLVPWLWSLVAVGFAYDFSDWLYRGLVFLVVSCPCALVVSIPLGYFGGIGAASRLGILFKGGNYLDAITKVDTVVFDKTGTLTRGEFEVVEARALDGSDGRYFLQWAASVEAGSNHPIAKAVVAYAKERGVALLPVETVTELAGFGMEAVVGGKRLLVGNLRLLTDRGVVVPEGVEREGCTCGGNSFCGVFASCRCGEGGCCGGCPCVESVKYSKYSNPFGRQAVDCH